MASSSTSSHTIEDGLTHSGRCTTVGHINESSPSQPGKRKRGKGRCLKYKKQRASQPGVVPLEIPSRLNRVVGGNANQFIAEMMMLVQQYCLLAVKDFGKIDWDIRCKLLAKAKDLFLIPNGLYAERAVMKQLKESFKRWRGNLKKIYYIVKETEEDCLTNCPLEIDPEDWRWLVAFWSSPKQVAISEHNRKICMDQKMPHHVGAKLIARIVHEMQSEPADSIEDQCPEYLKLFEREKNLNGTWVDEHAEAAYNALVKLHEEEIAKHGVDTLSTAEAFTKVLGHR